MNIIEVLDKLNSWWKNRQQAKKSTQRGAIRLAWEACHALVEIGDLRSDQGRLLQERVRNLHENLSTSLDGRLTPKELDIVISALGSARLYYWVRFLEGASEKELNEFAKKIEKQFHHLRPHDFDQLAFEQLDMPKFQSSQGFVALFLRTRRLGTQQQILAELRSSCLKNLSRLQELLDKHAL